MEYEQLEAGNKMINRIIVTQDVGAFYSLLSPNAILISHFPYPDGEDDGGGGSCDATKVLRQKDNPKRRKQQLLKETAERLAAQQERYRVQQAKLGGGGGGPIADRSGGASPRNGAADESSLASTTAGGGGAAAPSAGATASASKAKVGESAPRRAASRGAATRPPSVSDASGSAASFNELKGVTLFFSQPPPPQSSSAEAGAEAAANGDASGAAANNHDHYHYNSQPNMSDYGERVDIAEGRMLVAERFYVLLHWLGKFSFISEIRVQLEARKGILQESEVLPPPPVPITEQARYALIGRQHTDRNQRLSRLTVTWGSEDLLFRDQYYFDDGVVVTIHRRMLTLSEMLERTPYVQQGLTPTQRTDRIHNAVQDFYRVSKSRVNTVNKALPLLDFSFFHLSDPTELLKTKPLSGKMHVSRPPRPAVDPRLAQGVFLNQENDPTKMATSSRQLIKAKNKRGEEEAYEFDTENERFSFMDAIARKADASPDSMESLCKYDACSVRVATCRLGEGPNHGSIEKFMPVLRGLVANAFLTIQSLDLSDNRLSVLPDFSPLPLQKLSLHGNAITEWSEVEEKVCSLPFVFALTLHGNPIAENTKEYWPMLLSRLLRHHARQVRLKQLDFVTLTSQDYNVAGAFEMFSTGNKSVLEASKKMSATKSR